MSLDGILNFNLHLGEGKKEYSYKLKTHNDCKLNEAIHIQRAKKVVSDSLGLVDFAIGLVNSVLNLPDGQAKIFLRIKITRVL